MDIFKSHNFARFFTKNSGFTLLELLVVISVMGILTSGGIASFVSYNNKQILDQAALDLKTGIDLAKFDAVSKVKPTASPCDVAPLDRYKISISSTSTDLYDITAGCMVGTNLSWTSTLASKPLPTSVTITQSCSPEFSVLSGINAPCSVVLQDGSAYKTICIDGGGNTSISDGQVACGQAYIPVTPTPTSPPITLIPTPTPLPNPPNISQQWDTNVKDTTAVLNSTVDPNGGKTSITYRYSGVLNSYCNPQLTDTLAGPNGITSLSSPNSTNLTNLTGNTSYSYCATADNTPAGGGITNGVGNNNLSSNFLTLPSAPVITSVGSPTQTSLTVNWTPPTGGTATYSLYYCDNTAVPGCSPTTLVSNSISGVVTAYTQTFASCNNHTYAYQMTAVNNTGASAPSNIATGTTSSCATPPNVTTNTATSITSSQAVFNSSVNGNGYPTTITYRYQANSNPGCASLSSAIAGTNANFTGSVIDSTTVPLSASTPYYYCATATNAGGTTYGGVNSFTTSASCANGYKDYDGDGYGAGAYGCYPPGPGYTVVATGGDCYDYDGTNATIRAQSQYAHPGQTGWFSIPRGTASGVNDWAGNSYNSYDYNCDKVQTQEYTGITNYPFMCTTACGGGNTPGWQGSVPACGAQGTYSYGCQIFSDTSCNINISSSSSTCAGGAACSSADYLSYTQMCH